MLKLTYADLRSNEFKLAVRKIYGFTGIKDIRQVREIARLIKLLDKYSVEGDELLRKIAKDFAELDEAGELKIFENGAFKIKDEHMAAWKEKVEEFLKTEVEISSSPLHLDVLSGCQLSPSELVALEPLLATLEAV